MSTNQNLRNIREGSSSAPLEKEVTRLARVMARNASALQVEQVDEPEDIFPAGIDVETSVKYHDELTGTNQLFFDKVYYTTYEPDYNKVTLMLKGRHLGNELKDCSGFRRHATVFGEPLLVSGNPFDPGFHQNGTLSRAVRFNRPTSNYSPLEYLTVPDSTSIRLLGATSGISYMIRFRPMDLEGSDGLDARIWEKTDDNTPNHGIQFRYTSSGRIRFVLTYNGTELKRETNSGVVSAENVYTMFLTFNPTGNALKLYTCLEPGDTLIDQTLNTGSYNTNWHADLTGLNSKQLTLMNRSTGSEGEGRAYLDFYNLYIYRQQIVTSAEAQNMFTNKITIADNPFGQNMCSNHWATMGPTPVDSSFTSESFTSTSFNT